MESNLHEWEVKFQGFKASDPDERALAKGLEKVPGNAVTLRVVFPSTYPAMPPFIRVIRPRFAYMTGHVTLGGSICTQELTSSGWDPSLTIESVLLSIRTNMITGKAAIDHANRVDCTSLHGAIPLTDTRQTPRPRRKRRLSECAATTTGDRVRALLEEIE